MKLSHRMKDVMMEPLEYLSIRSLWLLISHSGLAQKTLSYRLKGQEIQQVFWARTEASMGQSIWRLVERLATSHPFCLPEEHSAWLVTPKEQ